MGVIVSKVIVLITKIIPADLLDRAVIHFNRFFQIKGQDYVQYTLEVAEAGDPTFLWLAHWKVEKHY